MKNHEFPDGTSPNDIELIAELLDCAPDDPRRTAILAERPDLADELVELERAATELDRRADDYRASEIETALASPAGGVEDRIAAFARSTMDGGDARASTARRGPRLAPWALGIAAAAAVLLFLFGGGWPGADGPGDGDARGDLMLGDEAPNGGTAAAQLAPTGVVEAWGAFRWTGTPSAGSFRRVRIWAADAADGPALVESDDLIESTWTPPTTTLAALPTAIRWQVVEIDGVTGDADVVHAAEARLAP